MGSSTSHSSGSANPTSSTTPSPEPSDQPSSERLSPASRRAGGLLVVIVLVALSGCMGIGSVTSEEGLHEEAEYEWDADADVRIQLTGDREFEAVYTVENESTIRLYRSTRYGTDRPLGIRAVQFRHTNGTVVNASAIQVEETRSEVYVTTPAENGQLAFTASHQTRHLTLPTYVEGSYEVILPEGYRADNFILGVIRPSGYEQTVDDDRLHIYWEEVTTGMISVRYYLARDPWVFGGLVAIVSVAGAIGLAYVWRQVKELQRRREEMGLDVDIEDDRDQPPPGMR